MMGEREQQQAYDDARRMDGLPPDTLVTIVPCHIEQSAPPVGRELVELVERELQRLRLSIETVADYVAELDRVKAHLAYRLQALDQQRRALEAWQEGLKGADQWRAVELVKLPELTDKEAAAVLPEPF